MNKKIKKIIQEKLLTKHKDIVVLNKKGISSLKKKFPIQYQNIIKLTSFLKNASFSERIYCICNKINFITICNKCGKKLIFLSFTFGYQKCKNIYCIQENGLTRAQNIGKKSRDTRKKIGLDGLTTDQRNGIKCSKTLKIVQENGLTIAQNRALKTAKTLTTTYVNGIKKSKLIGLKSSNTLKIVDENGLSGYQKNAIKQSNTNKKIEANGLTYAQNYNKKSVETRKKVGEDGLTIFQRNARKAAKTKKKVGDDGLTGYQRAGRKVSNTLNKVGENDLTIAQKRNKKAIETKKKIGDDGLTGFQRIARKIIETKKKVGDDGLTGFQRIAINTAKTLHKVGDDGLTGYQKASKKGSITRNTIGEDGLTIAQKTCKKISEIMHKVGEDGLDGYQRIVLERSIIGNDGLNSYERALKKSFHLKPYCNSKLLYQGSNEKNFLDLVSELNLLDNLCRAKSIRYEFEGKKHLYYADYELKNILFEIKSHWIYDNCGRKVNLRRKNHAKWLAAISQGYNLYIIWDCKWISKLSLNDFDIEEKDLYSTKTLFTKQLLLDIFERKY